MHVVGSLLGSVARRSGERSAEVPPSPYGGDGGCRAVVGDEAAYDRAPAPCVPLHRGHFTTLRAPAREAPWPLPVPLADYAARDVTGDTEVVVAAIYVDRLCTRTDLAIHPGNVHRVLLAALLLAT
eukprot:gene12907-65720_t